MDKLLPFLMPIFIVAIIVLNTLVKMKEMQKKQRAKQGGQWKELGGTDEIRKFLQQAGTGMSATPEKRAGAAPSRRAATTGQGFLPGAGGPVAGTFAAPGVVPSARRKTSRVRQAPPPPIASDETVVKRLVADQPQPDEHGSAGARDQENVAGKAAKPAGIGMKRSATALEHKRVAEKAAADAGNARQDKAARRVSELSRARLRDAIVMAEVLGTPVGFKAPRA